MSQFPPGEVTAEGSPSGVPGSVRQLAGHQTSEPSSEVREEVAAVQSAGSGRFPGDVPEEGGSVESGGCMLPMLLSFCSE